MCGRVGGERESYVTRIENVITLICKDTIGGREISANNMFSSKLLSFRPELLSALAMVSPAL